VGARVIEEEDAIRMEKEVAITGGAVEGNEEPAGFDVEAEGFAGMREDPGVGGEEEGLAVRGEHLTNAVEHAVPVAGGGFPVQGDFHTFRIDADDLKYRISRNFRGDDDRLGNGGNGRGRW
jgi:hypothetical protein